MTVVDIARIETSAVAVLGGASAALDRLGQWVTAAQQAHQLVAPLVDTAFVPEAYKPKVDPRATPEQRQAAYQVAVANATAAVLQGITLGLDPLTALQQIYIVHGRPGMYTDMKVALVKAHGHEVWVEDISDSRAVVCGRRKGTDYVERVTVTMDQARKAGWTKNEAYGKTPQDMLYARAAGRVCDRIAPDVLMGIASVEEIQDTIQATAEVGSGMRTVSPPKRRQAPAITAGTPEEPPLDDNGTPSGVEPEVAQAAATPKRRSQPQAVSEPEPDLALTDDAPADSAMAGPDELDDPITQPQMALMQKLFTDQEITEPQAKRDYCTQHLGRTITSVTELSKWEASKVIDTLTPVVEPSFDDEPDGGAS